MSGIRSSGSVPGWPAVDASPLPCAAMPGGSACCIAGWSTPALGSPTGGGVVVRCGGLCMSSAPTVGSSRCGWVGGASTWLHRPPVTPALGRGLLTRAAARVALPGSADREASAGMVVRAGSGPGSGSGAGRPGDDGFVGLTACPGGGAWCRWDASLACAVAGRSPGAVVLDVARAWGFGPSVGLWAWGCTASEGRVVVVSVGVAARLCVRGSLGGAFAGPAVGWSGVPRRGRGSGWACVAAARLAAGW